jgi:hypothetical protein
MLSRLPLGYGSRSAKCGLLHGCESSETVLQVVLLGVSLDERSSLPALHDGPAEHAMARAANSVEARRTPPAHPDRILHHANDVNERAFRREILSPALMISSCDYIAILSMIASI